MSLGKTVFTTGQAAKHCMCSQQTIIRCFDNGSLKGFRVPGSRFRRIPRDSLIQFMEENGIPLDSLYGSKLLVFSDDEEMTAELEEHLTTYNVVHASNPFDAGALLQDGNPKVAIVDFRLGDTASDFCALLTERKEYEGIPLICLANGELPDVLFSAVVETPCDVEDIVEQLSALMEE